MNKILRQLRKFRIERLKIAAKNVFAIKNKYRVALAVISVCVGLYLIVSMVLVSPVEICLEKLRRSFNEEVICHEICESARKAYSYELIKDLRLHTDSKVAQDFEKYLLNEDSNLEFRLKIIQILKEADGENNPPTYLLAYLNQGKNAQLRAEIISFFNVANVSNPSDPLGIYFDIISGYNELVVKLAAINSVGSAADKSEIFNNRQLEIIKDIIFNSGTDKRLRQPLVLLLSDYYQFFPDETRSILITLFLTEASGDEISRAFAADILNRLSNENLVVPEVSAKEWADYYSG